MSAFDTKMDECASCGKQDDINWTSAGGNWRICWNCDDAFCPDCATKNLSPCASCEDTFCNDCLSTTTEPEPVKVWDNLPAGKRCQDCINGDTVGQFRGDFRLKNKSQDIFEDAWALVKAPIDVYSDRGRIGEVTDDEMLYSGGDFRDDSRYYSTDPDVALHYALYGSAIPYADFTGRRNIEGKSSPPMRRTIPSISTIDPSDFEEYEYMMREDPYSPGIGFIDDENMGERLSHDRVIELLQEYIDERRYEGVLGGSTGELFTPEQRGRHAKDALKRLRAYRDNESLERFIPNPPTYVMDADVFRTAEYDDFMEALSYDDSMVEMLGEWEDLEDWQRKAAEEAGFSEDDWI